MKIVALGDSITAGFPYGNHVSWTTVLARELNCEVINQGIDGDYTSGMRNRFGHDVLRYQPSHVTILGGSNDAAARIELTSVSANFIAMIDMCRENNIVPILCLQLPILETHGEHCLSQYRDWVRNYAAENSIFLIDFYKPFMERVEAGQHRELYCDLAHPSTAGYALMGEIVLEHIRNPDCQVFG